MSMHLPYIYTKCLCNENLWISVQCNWEIMWPHEYSTTGKEQLFYHCKQISRFRSNCWCRYYVSFSRRNKTKWSYIRQGFRGWNVAKVFFRAVSTSNFKVLDVKVMSRNCKACASKDDLRKSNKIEFDKWNVLHEPSCKAWRICW